MTGAVAAVKLDMLLALGVEDPFALSEQEQRELIERGAAEGRLPGGPLSFLREHGAIAD